MLLEGVPCSFWSLVISRVMVLQLLPCPTEDGPNTCDLTFVVLGTWKDFVKCILLCHSTISLSWYRSQTSNNLGNREITRPDDRLQWRPYWSCFVRQIKRDRCKVRFSLGFLWFGLSSSSGMYIRILWWRWFGEIFSSLCIWRPCWVNFALLSMAWNLGWGD